jgi:hypothetical protein
MSSNPHARPPLRSEDDPSSSQVSESLGRLRLDEPTDDGGNPSMTSKSTPLSTQRAISIPEGEIKEMCEILEDTIRSSHSDDRVKSRLGIVWVAVNHALKTDDKLEPLANQEEFRANVEKEGEQQFIKLLKGMATTKTWTDLLDNSMSFLSSDCKCSDPILSPGVFYKQIQANKKEPAQSKWTEASMIGAHRS